MNIFKNGIIFFALFVFGSNAKPIVESTINLGYSDEFPSRIIVVKKMYDPETKTAWIESDDKSIKCREDIDRYYSKKNEVFRKKHGALDKNLVGLLNKKNSDEKIKVILSLKISQTECLDKTKCSEDELRQSSLKALKIEQNDLKIKKYYISKKHHIEFGTENEESFSNVITLTKTQIEQLAMDTAVASLEEYIEPQILSCSALPGGAQEFKSLSNAAYNPATSMNPLYMGNGVNASTFESGIHSTILQCIGNRGQNISVVDVSNDTSDNHKHSNWTFECLAQTATNANLYHRASWSYSSNVNWIINNNINTVSMSITNGGLATSEQNRVVDHFAYRYPYTTFCNPTSNGGHCFEANWQCYNAINVGNVRQTNETHYEMMGLNIPCQPGPGLGNFFGDAVTQSKNPVSITGHNNIPFDLDCVALGGCATNDASDREMPHIVAPGYGAYVCGHSTSCLQTVFSGQGGWGGTSFSAPVTNGIAACVQSANNSFKSWPELTRATIVLTAHNVYGDYWSPVNDGIDGAGVISGVDAVLFALNATSVSQSNNAVERGYNMGSIPENTGSYYNIDFSIKVPDTKPAGKHLRIVLTWDSSPSLTPDSNKLADLDLVVPGYTCPFNNNDNWGTWESNVEVADIASNRLTPGSIINPFIRVWDFTIPASAYNKSMNAIYYSIAWTWVKDHAD